LVKNQNYNKMRPIGQFLNLEAFSKAKYLTSEKFEELVNNLNLEVIEKADLSDVLETHKTLLTQNEGLLEKGEADTSLFPELYDEFAETSIFLNSITLLPVLENGKIIQKAVRSLESWEKAEGEFFAKAGGGPGTWGDPQGTIKEWKGVKYQKVGKKWVPYKGGQSTKFQTKELPTVNDLKEGSVDVNIGGNKYTIQRIQYNEGPEYVVTKVGEKKPSGNFGTYAALKKWMSGKAPLTNDYAKEDKKESQELIAWNKKEGNLDEVSLDKLKQTQKELKQFLASNVSKEAKEEAKKMLTRWEAEIDKRGKKESQKSGGTKFKIGQVLPIHADDTMDVAGGDYKVTGFDKEINSIKLKNIKTGDIIELDEDYVNHTGYWKNAKVGIKPIKKSEDLDNLNDINPFEENIDNIVKSHVWEAFDSADNFISKTGKEIKEQIVGVIEEEETEKTKHLTEFTQLKSQLPLEPTKDVYEWNFRGVKSSLTDVPKQYDYDIFNYGEAKLSESPVINLEAPVKSIEQGSAPTKLTPEQTKVAQKYNNLVEKYIDCQVEIVKLNTLLNNLDDNKSYKLTVHQASLLKF